MFKIALSKSDCGLLTTLNYVPVFTRFSCSNCGAELVISISVETSSSSSSSSFIQVFKNSKECLKRSCLIAEVNFLPAGILEPHARYVRGQIEILSLE